MSFSRLSVALDVKVEHRTLGHTRITKDELLKEDGVQKVSRRQREKLY